MNTRLPTTWAIIIASLCLLPWSPQTSFANSLTCMQRAINQLLEEKLPDFKIKGSARVPTFEEIHAEVQANGYYVVTEGLVPRSPTALRELEKLYGVEKGRLRFTGDFHGRKSKLLPGVVIHIDEHPLVAADTWMGTVNPTLSNLPLQDSLLAQKWEEYLFSETIAPGAMPKTTRSKDMFTSVLGNSEATTALRRVSHLLDDFLPPQAQLEAIENLQTIIKKSSLSALSDFKSKTRQVRELINDYLHSTQMKFPKDSIPELNNLLKSFFSTVRESFPDGAYIKHVGEFKTGDTGQLITSFASSEEDIARRFIKDLEAYKAKRLRTKVKQARASGFLGSATSTGIPDYPAGRRLRVSIEDDHVQEALYDNMHSSTTLMLSLLRHPEDVMVQQAVRLTKTPLGKTTEIRVDIAAGKPVGVYSRYTFEYLPDEVKRAREYVQKICDDVRINHPELVLPSAGVDVGFYEGGKMGILEWNADIRSSFTSPTTYPISANNYISAIIGKPTPIMKELQATFSAGIEDQLKYLQRFHPTDDYLKSYSETRPTLVVEWLRDQYMERWLAQPTEKTAKSTWKNLKRLVAEAKKTDEAAGQLLLGIREHMQKVLGKKITFR